MADVAPFPPNVLDRFARLGVDTDELLRRAELPRSRFATPKPLGTTAELFALWRAVEQCDVTPDFGLRLGGDPLPQHQTIASLAMLHSATLGDGFQKLARYKRLVCPEQVTIDVARGETRVQFVWLYGDGLTPPLLIDAIFASLVGLARRGTGEPLRLRRVELTRRRRHAGVLREHFGCEVRFDAPFDVLVFDESAFALPLVTHDPQILAAIVPGLEAALEERGAERSLADDVRTALVRHLSGERPAVESVAKVLGLSPRTLQRRLGELGTSYQALLDDVRHRTARRLLSHTDLGTGEVAFLLGFEEHNSFTRAFRSWEGTTPARWRAVAR